MVRGVWNDANVTAKRRLVPTGTAAAELSVDRATLFRWARDGKVRPTETTVGGHMRWDLDDLRDQIRKLQEGR